MHPCYCNRFSAPTAVRRQTRAPEANARFHTLSQFIWSDDDQGGDGEEKKLSVRPMMMTILGFRPELVG